MVEWQKAEELDAKKTTSGIASEKSHTLSYPIGDLKYLENHLFITVFIVFPFFWNATPCMERSICLTECFDIWALSTDKKKC